MQKHCFNITPYEPQDGQYRIGEAKKPGPPPKKNKKVAKGTRNIRATTPVEILIEECEIPQRQRCNVVGGCRVHRTWWQACIEERTQGGHPIGQPPWPSIPVANRIQQFETIITDDNNYWNQICNDSEISKTDITLEAESWKHFNSQNNNSRFSDHLEPPPVATIDIETNTNNIQTPMLDNLAASIKFFDNLTQSDSRIRLDTNEADTLDPSLGVDELLGMQAINTLMQTLQREQPSHNQDQLDIEVTPTLASPYRELAPSVADMSSCSAHTNMIVGTTNAQQAHGIQLSDTIQDDAIRRGKQLNDKPGLNRPDMVNAPGRSSPSEHHLDANHGGQQCHRSGSDNACGAGAGNTNTSCPDDLAGTTAITMAGETAPVPQPTPPVQVAPPPVIPANPPVVSLRAVELMADARGFRPTPPPMLIPLPQPTIPLVPSPVPQPTTPVQVTPTPATMANPMVPLLPATALIADTRSLQATPLPVPTTPTQATPAEPLILTPEPQLPLPQTDVRYPLPTTEQTINLTEQELLAAVNRWVTSFEELDPTDTTPPHLMNLNFETPRMEFSQYKKAKGLRSPVVFFVGVPITDAEIKDIWQLGNTLPASMNVAAWRLIAHPLIHVSPITEAIPTPTQCVRAFMHHSMSVPVGTSEA